MRPKTYEVRPWETQAACKNLGATGKIFSSGVPHDTFVAKELCARCPVARPCLEWAMAHDEIGIWGGQTEDERIEIRLRRRTSVR